VWKLTAEQKAEVESLYISGVSSVLIAEKFGISHQAIRGILSRRNVVIRDASACIRRLPLDETAFSRITNDSAYWIGFLMADGSVVGNEVGVALSQNDLPHLISFREFMKSEHAITPVQSTTRGGYTNKPTFRYSFKSRRIVDDLSKHGVIPNKSKSAVASAELAKNSHFWRGVIDGDGSIDLPRTLPRYAGPVVRLVGSEMLLNQFSELVRTISPRWRGSVRPHKSIFALSVSGEMAIEVLGVLYRDAAFALPRKENAARNILRAGTQPAPRTAVRRPTKRELKRVA
jgi:hypothetical protein